MSKKDKHIKRRYRQKMHKVHNFSTKELRKKMKKEMRELARINHAMD